MIVEIGHFALVLALAAALAQTVVPFWGARIGDGGLMGVGRSAALTQLLLIAIAFAALVDAHLTSDFSVLNVAENSHSAVPAIYKISGVWGNHEGSMLLWVLILAVFGGLVALFGRGLPSRLRADALAVQGLISVAFLAFILLTSNPFERLSPAPFEGRDLNPILQDPGLAIHPPLLYLGYVGFSIVYSFAAAALIEGRIDAAWARFVRPFTLVAWSFLTLGIAAGSFWAYYTLGWGGFWFWDPVENASLMPWLAGTAFVHSVAVMEKRDALKVWTIFLAILAFSFSLLGTFLVRSGVLTSVHAFASDPRRGVFILVDSGAVHFRLVRALRLASPDAQAGRTVRADLARRRADRQQSPADDLVRDRAVRHALPAGARAIDRREDHRRRAVFQPDLRRAVADRLLRRPVRVLARLEARRSPGGRPAADRRPGRRRGDRGPRLGVAQRRVGLRAACGGPRDLRHFRHADRSRHARAAAGPRACRCVQARARAAVVVLRRRARPYRRRGDAAWPLGARLRRRDDRDPAQGRPRTCRALFDHPRLGRGAGRARTTRRRRRR